MLAWASWGWPQTSCVTLGESLSSPVSQLPSETGQQGRCSLLPLVVRAWRRGGFLEHCRWGRGQRPSVLVLWEKTLLADLSAALMASFWVCRAAFHPLGAEMPAYTL